MKFTQLLYKQHIGKAKRYVWQHQRERKIVVSKAEQILKSMNFLLQDATEFILRNPKTEFMSSQNALHNNKIIENSVALKKSTLDVNSKNYLVFEDYNVLQEGVPQALLLTKTVKLNDELPEKIQKLITDIPKNINNLSKRSVYTSMIYDAQQVKLPKLKDPERPAWVFPRVYGITSTRKMQNLSKKFLQLCESLCGLNDAQYKSVIHDGLLSTCIGIIKK